MAIYYKRESGREKLTNYIGTIIRKLRNEKGLTQLQLSDNEMICSIKQLSRIENNKSNPSTYLLNRFSLMLGNSLIEYLPYSNCLYGYEVKKEIDVLLNLFNQHRHRKILKSMEESEIFKKTSSVYAKQEIAWMRGAISHYIDVAETIDDNYYINLLKSSHEFSNLTEIFNTCLNAVEYRILNSLIVIYLENSKFEIAEDLLLKSISSYERNYFQITDTSYVRFIYNLSRFYYNSSRFDEAMSVSQKGIDHCIRNNDISYLADLYNINGRSNIKTGNKKYGKELLSYYETLRKIYDPDIDYKKTLETLHEIYGEF